MLACCRGGSILSAILHWQQEGDTKPLDISALVRSASQAAVVNGLDRGVHSITVKGFDELDELVDVGKQFDSMSITSPNNDASQYLSN